MRTGSGDVPEVLQAAGISWKIYQDLAGATFSPDFGDGTGNSFAGNYTDNSVLYFNQYVTRSDRARRCFDNGCTGTEIINTDPERVGASRTGLAGLGRAPVRPVPKRRAERQTAAGFLDRGAGRLYRTRRIGRSTTAPGTSRRSSTSWCPTPRCSARPSSSSTTTRPTEASTTSCRRHPPHIARLWRLDGQHRKRDRHHVDPAHGPIGLGTRVPFLAISPWSKGGYVNSQVFDHTSVIQFIEKRFGVLRPISRRGAVRWRVT